MSTHKIFLMGKNSIDYFSKMAFYLEAEPLPDPSLSIFGMGCQFFQAMGQECGGWCLVHTYLLRPRSGSASRCAGCTGGGLGWGG